MATEIAKAYVQILPSTDGLGNAITKDLGGEMKEAGASASGGFGAAFANGLKTAGKIGAAAIGVASAAVVGFGKSAVEAGLQFDSSMSQVAATMGFATDELNDSTSEASQTMQELRDFAQEMGSTTAFSASEAADALNYMALAGYDAQTSMTMLPNVLNLAAAGGIDLASASDMVTDAQSALGLSLDETSTMVDQMARASSKSNTSVAQLGEAFLTIGATAKTLKGGTTELSTALGILADNGVKGAEGGTALRNILLSLQNPTDKAAGALNDLGFQAYDSMGNMRSLEDIFQDMNTAMADFTEQQKSAYISEIFNKTDIAKVNALLNTTTDRWEELSSAIEDSEGAAQNMAEVQLDNLQGDMTLFQSALEGAKIAVSDGLTPQLRELVQFGSSGLSQLTEAFKEGGIGGAMSAFGDILSNAITMISSMLPQIVTAGVNLLKAFVDGIKSALPELSASGFEVLNTLIDAIVDLLPELLDLGLQMVVALAEGLADNIDHILAQAVNLIDKVGQTLIKNLPKILVAGIKLVSAIIEGIGNNLPKLVQTLTEIGTNMASTLIKSSPELIVAGIDLLVALINGLIQTIPVLVENLPMIINAIKKAFKDIDWAELGRQIINGIVNGIKNGVESIKKAAREAAKSALDSAKNALSIHSPSRLFDKEIGLQIDAGWARGIRNNADMVSSATKDVSSLAYDTAKVSSVSASGKYTASSYAPQGASMDGVSFTLNDTISLDGTPLKERCAQYTIRKIGNQYTAVRTARGGR